jgi:hypothetical protein
VAMRPSFARDGKVAIHRPSNNTFNLLHVLTLAKTYNALNDLPSSWRTSATQRVMNVRIITGPG